MGLDPLKFLLTEDGFERGLMMELATRSQKYRQILDQNLARAIANAVAESFK
jgi:hypothetical protein